MTPEELKRQVANLASEELRAHLERFARTPAGRAIKFVSKELNEAKKQGKDLTGEDFLSICMRIPKAIEEDSR